MAVSGSQKLPLSGLKVIELGQLIAGPFATKLLGEFGADVIKIEAPKKGDPLRKWRILEEGTSLWWHVQSRNKKSVTVDLQQAEGQAIVKKLACEADIIVENFRPGKLAQWGLGYAELCELNPKLILAHVSGYGQTGPYRQRPGFGVVGEAMGGMRYLSGEPNRSSVRIGISIGDSLSALYAVIGILLALQERQHSGVGQEIDVALYESVFSMMESLVPEYDAAGVIRQPSGSALPGITPSNAYLCNSGEYVLIAGNGDGIFKRLMHVINRDDLGASPDLAHNDGRTKRAKEIDMAITEWTKSRSRDEILKQLDAAGVPAGFPYTAADICADPHYQAREMIETMMRKNGKPLKVPGIVPKLSRTPGKIGNGGPSLGAHTHEVLRQLGIQDAELEKLHQRGIV